MMMICEKGPNIFQHAFDRGFDSNCDLEKLVKVSEKWNENLKIWRVWKWNEMFLQKQK